MQIVEARGTTEFINTEFDAGDGLLLWMLTNLTGEEISGP